MQNQHVNPEEAVKIHKLVRSKKSLAIHWGTYRMGSNEVVFNIRILLIRLIFRAIWSQSNYWRRRSKKQMLILKTFSLYNMDRLGRKVKNGCDEI